MHNDIENICFGGGFHIFLSSPSPLDGGPLLSMAALSSPYQSSPLSLLVERAYAP